GISGTNAHIVVEEAPVPEGGHQERPAPTHACALPLAPWTLSATSEAALRDQAGRLAAHLVRHPGHTLADIGHTLATTRTAFDHRAVLLTPGLPHAIDQLTHHATGRETAELITGSAHHGSGPVFVFPGQGSQWV
ncbi:acyl transferase, partial [Streptomyces hygroscopicus subsp. hygroscopicus]|nr:acyl transferase [Streptomyces hygroscopicus subsp. hygroscopicus]